MIEEHAVVVDIRDDWLMLEARVQSSCGSCEAKAGCGTSVLGGVLGRKFTRFTAANSIGARVGDEVIVGIPEQSLLTGSLVIYLLPIASMLVSALIADHFTSQESEGWLASLALNHDLFVALSAAAGFGLGAMLSRYYFSRASSAILYTPVVLRKIISRGRI